jgi:hypothetical protein
VRAVRAVPRHPTIELELGFWWSGSLSTRLEGFWGEGWWLARRVAANWRGRCLGHGRRAGPEGAVGPWSNTWRLPHRVARDPSQVRVTKKSQNFGITTVSVLSCICMFTTMP